MTAPFLPHLVGGAPRPGVRTFDDVDPATGRVLARVARGEASDVGAAVEAARRALEGPWGRMPAPERAGVLERAASILEARAEELARLESEDTGKTVRLARTLDVPRAVQNLRFFAGALRHDETPAHRMPGALNYTVRKPLGVVGLVTPWNLPLYLLTWKAAPALAMGNAVVAKPSELTPRTANALAEALAEAGLPPGAFNVVHGTGPEAGEALVRHPGVRAISFTGGTATGVRVAESAASPHPKKLSLELGGKNPTLVFADADLDLAVEGAVRAGFTNQGQICLCGSRILVDRRIERDFVPALVEKVRALQVGDPADDANDLGALVSLDHREKVEGYLRLAREEGGEVLCGGDRPPLPPPFDAGAFLSPAVVTGLPPSCRFATEEVFGPVVSVHAFDTEDEAIAIANGVRYGLAASVWTRDLRRAHRVAERLETGMVWVNTWLKRDLRVPFGGVKASGVGREGGAWSFDFYSEATNVCIDLGDLP